MDDFHMWPQKWVSSIVQLFDFLTIDIDLLCITGNFGDSFDILTFDFLL